MIVIDWKNTIKNIGKSSHLVFYIPVGTGDATLISRSIIMFKEGITAAVDLWSELLAEELGSVAGDFDAILRPLSSKETAEHIPGPLDVMGKRLGEKLGIPYLPQFFIKDEVRQPLHKISSGAKRYNVLIDNYHLKYNINPAIIGKARFLLIDDVTTSGSTVRVIADIIHKYYPDISLSFAALARTSHQPRANEGFFEIIERIKATGIS